MVWTGFAICRAWPIGWAGPNKRLKLTGATIVYVLDNAGSVRYLKDGSNGLVTLKDYNDPRVFTKIGVVTYNGVDRLFGYGDSNLYRSAAPIRPGGCVPAPAFPSEEHLRREGVR